MLNEFVQTIQMDTTTIKTRALQALLKKGLENTAFQPTGSQISLWCETHTQSGMTQQDFDLVLVASTATAENVYRYLPFYLKNIAPKRIVLITKITAPIRALFAPHTQQVSLIDEDSLLDGLTFAVVQKLAPSKTGWYLQQFLKMAYALRCEDSYYCLMDGDTVPLRPLSFFDTKRPVFFCKGEYYKPYFSMIDTLFKGTVQKCTPYSFIAECMIISTHVMRSIISEIISNNAIPGDTFFEKILRSVYKKGLDGSDFSEFETYGNYIASRYPGTFILKKLRTLREAQKFFHNIPPSYALNYLSRDFDTVSFESKHLTENNWTLLDYINKCMATQH